MTNGRTLAAMTAPATAGAFGASVTLAIAAVAKLVATPGQGAAPATG